MRERLEILCKNKKPNVKFNNSRTELYKTCLHRPHFHRYSTGEDLAPKKMIGSNLPNFDPIALNINAQRS